MYNKSVQMDVQYNIIYYIMRVRASHRLVFLVKRQQLDTIVNVGRISEVSRNAGAHIYTERTRVLGHRGDSAYVAGAPTLGAAAAVAFASLRRKATTRAVLRLLVLISHYYYYYYYIMYLSMYNVCIYVYIIGK